MFERSSWYKIMEEAIWSLSRSEGTSRLVNALGKLSYLNRPHVNCTPGLVRFLQKTNNGFELLRMSLPAKATDLLHLL